MTLDPGSYSVGPPSEHVRPPSSRRGMRQRRQRRLMESYVDSWLQDGGWRGGRESAGSLALNEADTPEARQLVRGRWRQELIARGWTSQMVTSRWRVEERGRHLETRFYWWTTDEWKSQPMPVSPGGEDEGEEGVGG
ncbi:hypothetical protein [Frankia sp. Cj3]|uniref:hypothetical protein n=1 Tax=Frankia sp. Cj3 TaxID=2880976 RepID=UPI001EF3F3A9|nr:hypothetical protein [Frankia sp. Cj3]